MTQAHRLLVSIAMKQIADALELLTAQHEVISIELVRIGTVAPSEWAHPLGELADQVATHLAIEEQFLSTHGIAVDVASHDELRSALADLLAVNLSSPAAAEQLARFTERWTAHATAQDHSIFIALAELLTPDLLKDVGLQLGAWAEQSRCIAA
jgi:hemerythrin